MSKIHIIDNVRLLAVSQEKVADKYGIRDNWYGCKFCHFVGKDEAGCDFPQGQDNICERNNIIFMDKVGYFKYIRHYNNLYENEIQEDNS